LQLSQLNLVVEGERSEAPQPTERERKWFAARLDSGQHRRITEEVTITPGLAALMLRHNVGNRPCSRKRVDKHVQRLQRGDFILTHQGIAFANNGVLNDGQHRLTAIAESGIPALLQVTFGAEREEFHVIDQSDKRSASDALSILGENNSALRAAVARSLLVIKTGDVHVDQQLVADYAMEIRGPDMDEAINFAQKMTKLTAPSSVAVAYYTIKKNSNRLDKFEAFWECLPTGEGLTGAKLKLREWLRERVVAKKAGDRNGVWRSAVIINAWNSYVVGRKTFSTEWNHVIKLPDVR
jgi:hypothetical protein